MTLRALVAEGIREPSPAISGYKGTATAAAAMAVFALLWVVIEWIGPKAGVPALEVVWLRYGTHLVLLTLLLGPRYGAGLVRTHHLGLHILRSLTMLGMPISFLAGLKFMEMRDLESDFWLGVAACTVAAALVGHARGIKRVAFASVVALGGAFLILAPGSHFLGPAAMFPLAMAAFFMAYQFLTHAMVEESELSKLFHTALWVFLILSPYVLTRWRTPTGSGFLAAVGIGVLGCGALYALDIAVGTVSPLSIAAVSFLQPLFAAAGTYSLLHGAHPSARLLFGAAGILVGVLVYLIPQRRKAQEEARP